MREVKKAWLTAWRVSGNAELEVHAGEHEARSHARKLIDDGVTSTVFVAEVHARAERDVVFK